MAPPQFAIVILGSSAVKKLGCELRPPSSDFVERQVFRSIGVITDIIDILLDLGLKGKVKEGHELGPTISWGALIGLHNFLNL